MPAQPIDPTTTYLHLAEGPAVTPIEGGPDFWPTIDQRPDLQTGRLITSFPQTDSWDVWEQHPEGDEVIVALSGTYTFHLDDGTTTTYVEVGPAELVVVPKGSWHTADVHEPGQILVITWGEGTTHKPRAA